MNIKSSSLGVLRSHLANERTLLAYLRTGIAFISFGLTLNRFSLYLIENNMNYKGKPFLNDTKNVGIGMVILGTLLLLWAISHFLKTAKEIDALAIAPAKWSLLFFAILVVLMGAATTFWMILG